VFAVAAGSFQCVWFFSLGERHHKPVFEWVQQQLAQQQQQQEGEVAEVAAGAGAAAAATAAGPAYCVVASTREVPEVSFWHASHFCVICKAVSTCWLCWLPVCLVL
jgi:hypothetical protein